MDERLDNIGGLIRQATTQYVKSKRKYRDLQLGKLLGLVMAADALGEGRYARDCIQEALEDLGGFGARKQMLRIMF